MVVYTSLVNSNGDLTQNGSQNMQPAQLGHVIQPHPNHPTGYSNYRNKQSLGLGVLQIIVGVLCIIFNGVGLGFLFHWSAWTHIIGHGIWGGILFIITGSFGIAAAKSATKCKVIAFMVLCIISACACAVLVILGVIGALVIMSSSCQKSTPHYDLRGYHYEYYTDPECMNSYNVSVAMNALIACLGFIECIAAIWGSVICCKVACCCSNSNTNIIAAPIQLVTIPGNQQMLTIPQQQMFAVPLQQQAYSGQVIFAYSQGYPSQPMINVAAPPYQPNPVSPPYQANPNIPPHEGIPHALPKTTI